MSVTITVNVTVEGEEAPIASLHLGDQAENGHPDVAVVPLVEKAVPLSSSVSSPGLSMQVPAS